MAEEHKLILTLVPKVDTAALQGALSGTTTTNGGYSGPHQTGANPQNPSGGGGGGGGGGTGGTGGASAESGGASAESGGETTAAEQGRLHGIARLSNILSRGLSKLRKSSEDGDDSSAEEKRNELKKKLISGGVQAGTQAFKSIAQTSLGIVEDIYKQMKNASPLLQAIESMFNLAVTLFFMPLGNKLGEMLIPATIDLLDEVTKIWDSFEGKTLGDAIGYAVEKGVKIFSGYIYDIADELEGQSGIVGSMAKFLNTIADFVEHKLADVLEGLLNFAGWILEHFKSFISLYVSMSTAQIGATMGSSFWAGPLGPIIGALAGGGIGFAGTYSALSIIGMSEGGVVPATEGGQLRILGEGGEDEYVIPESKMDKMLGGGGSITNNWYITCNTTEDIVELIDDRISRQISRSKIQSGF